MNNGKGFKSVFRLHLDAFYNDHRATHGTSVSLLEHLHTFDSYLFRIGFKGPYFLEEDYEKWIKTMPHNKPITVNRKTMAVRRFLTYMRSIGIECYIPKPMKPCDSDFVPYVFSHDEIRRIFEIADSLRINIRNRSTILMTLPVLLRILYSTGIRIGECLKIRNEDVDYVRHTINIDRNNTKNRCQRIVVMRPSLETTIKQYVGYRNRLPIDGISDPKSPLIVSGTGKTPSFASIQTWFVRILKLSGIPYKSDHQGPSIHCLRHTACVHAMYNLVKSGRDMYVALPILSAYMGHRDTRGTEHYIRLTQEIYPDVIKEISLMDLGFENIISQIIINHNNENDGQNKPIP